MIDPKRRDKRKHKRNPFYCYTKYMNNKRAPELQLKKQKEMYVDFKLKGITCDSCRYLSYRWVVTSNTHYSTSAMKKGCGADHTEIKDSSKHLCPWHSDILLEVYDKYVE